MTGQKRLPEVYYVRRRVAAVIIVLLLVVLAVIAMTKLGGSNSQEDVGQAANTEQPSPTPTREDADTTPTGDPSKPSDAAIAAPTSAPPTSEEQKPEQPVKDSCTLDDLIVTANTDRPTYDQQTQPTFYMTVKNPTGADCDIDLSKDILRFEVYDMTTNRRIWSDVDCNPPEDTKKRVYPAGSETYYEAKWSRTTSAPKQCNDRQPVPAGAYYLHTLVGNNHSDAHPFNLK
ncbi:hypothetical protein [Corynebacterium aquilae]|uniref:Uncharacterized protein n=1 Tax=Corynebacterium aquilae DSM 44791 TaxID=1431546 RepID=A0A1L7CI21_9CORY|nr:hypothetical protein [Corynebacterium aquilae]APT85478.1 hypothetical protein CAQU_10925 [Corynebacterium aquilae DSM 44791]